MPVYELFRDGTPRDNGAGPPDNGDMEARVAKLEVIAEKTSDRLANIERDLAVLRAESKLYATKEDLHRELHGTTWKLVGAIILAQLLPALPAMLRGLKLIT